MSIRSELPHSTLRHSGNVPPANVTETSKDYLLELATPGLVQKDFIVEITNHTLSISSERKEEMKQENVSYTRKEFTYSLFNRAFTLPDNVKESNVDAKYDNGILKVIIPKKEITVSKLPREIAVS